MRVLLTNDDGIHAPGITTCANTLFSLGHEVHVVAPDRERSSIGHAVTLTRPICLRPPHERGAYVPGLDLLACDGTPSDCVVLGVETIAPETEIVVSGINRGPNLGDDLTYSGTVSAAMEGAILGKPALAVSLNCGQREHTSHYESAGRVCAEILRLLSRFFLHPGLLLNVNVPNLPLGDIRGVRVTRKGVRLYEEKVSSLNSPEGTLCFWVSGRPADRLEEEGSDVWAVANGYVSVTPIHMDMTHFPSLDGLRETGVETINFLS
jgi:5'-nucleotidase